MTTHGWNTNDNNTKPLTPLPTECIHHLFTSEGPLEGMKEHHQLADKHGFQFRTLLGELMYAYVTCRPNIGYAIITLSKFSNQPSDFHFSMLKKVTLYL